jgi:hypothetical protein
MFSSGAAIPSGGVAGSVTIPGLPQSQIFVRIQQKLKIARNSHFHEIVALLTISAGL